MRQADVPLRRTLRATVPIDLHLTLASLRHGGADPTISFESGQVWRATRTPLGPATIALSNGGATIDVTAWGPGAEWAVEHAPAQGDDPDAILIGGGSCIVSPFGVLLAGPARDGETILTADLDLEDIARGTFDLDAVGHYARPDVFRLSVDERPRPAVVPAELQPEE